MDSFLRSISISIECSLNFESQYVPDSFLRITLIELWEKMMLKKSLKLEGYLDNLIRALFG
jgi:hypothetical protein